MARLSGITRRSTWAAVVALIVGAFVALPAHAAHDGPHASITDFKELEGDAGTTTFEFTISIDQAPGIGDDWTIAWTTTALTTGDGTDATAGSDFVAASGDERFFWLGDTSTSRTISVTVNGDTDVEEDELFAVDISSDDPDVAFADARGIGLILDDDFVPELSISDASVDEGDSGATNMVFTASLSEAINETVTVDYATANGTATVADEDYEASSGTLTFPPGATIRTVPVAVIGDTKDEAPSENMRVTLSDATNATIVDADGIGTIVDDDRPPTIEAGSNRGVETAVSRLYGASVTGAPGADLTVTWDFGDGTEGEVGNPVSHRFAAVGIFTVTATVTDGKGGSASDSFTVETFDTGAVGRSWGQDRVQTAVAASQTNWPSSTDALIALADNYPDALAAGPLSAKLDAPLLLSGRDALPPIVEDELRRLEVDTVWLLGGEASLSAAIQQRLQALGYEVHRRDGINRFETAAAVAREVGRNSVGEVVVTLGEHAEPSRAFPDALSAGSLSASPQRMPVLLTRTGDLPAVTEQALADLQTEKVWIVGGESSVSGAVEARLRALGYETERLSGDGRYATSVDVATEALGRTAAGPVRIVLATGAAFPDGLTGGAVAARVEGILLLVPNGDLPSSTQQFLSDNADRFDVGVILGGSTTLSENVRLAIARLIDN